MLMHITCVFLHVISNPASADGMRRFIALSVFMDYRFQSLYSKYLTFTTLIDRFTS